MELEAGLVQAAPVATLGGGSDLASAPFCQLALAGGVNTIRKNASGKKMCVRDGLRCVGCF